MNFYVGLHQPSDAKHFERCFISINRLRRRRSNFAVAEWIMDSGAFSELLRYGAYRHSAAEYAAHIRRWRSCGQLQAAVAQDYMCEPFILRRTGLSIREHQELTISRYDALLAEQVGVYVMPVLQGYAPWDYVQHIRLYGERLNSGAWVGVGSVCKRNGNPYDVQIVLRAIRTARPDLRLHGFGLKTTALESAEIRSYLYSADSMAWSFHARRNGRNANDWREAAHLVARIDQLMMEPEELPLLRLLKAA